ncbi:MAG: polysaccharide biosynthesis protein [Bacteroidetes bacterium]|nr:polysaccharide biosynthesis protein [Bacteroidota bacterium]MBL7105532.1 polysaccharide biosynthesis protein [Bacteroidales bacterium]
MLITRQNIPRWLIFLIDIFIVLFSIILAYLLRFNFHIPEIEIKHIPQVLAVVIGIRALSFIISKTYAGIIRYTSTEDAVRIFLVILSGSILFAAANLISYYFINESYIIPFSIIIIEFITVIFAMITFRILVKMAYLELINPSREKTKVIIYGAGEAGLITKRALDRDVGTRNKVTAFIDDDKNKQGKKLEGVNIYSFEKTNELLESDTIDNIIIAVQKLKPEKKQAIVDVCLAYDTKVLTVPPVTNWINGELSFNQIKKIKIEDLLERDEIKLDVEKIRRELTGKVIMITGASGSIGSELVRQILNFNPKKIVLIDQAESALFVLEVELTEKYPSGNFEIAITDICNKVRMENAFKIFQPEIVYHAAAYKHVPMMENNPSEALYTNIKGTKIVADLAMKYGVQKFIMISTDKAVNPTSVMGASKRIAEIYTQSLNQKNGTKFITTRFGNVLGSNGSAVTLFRKQIEKGGTVMVTHPEVIRYFMTITEACRLVLEAGMMGKGGEIYLFDMGNPVKIVDLAKKMIALSGLEIDKDIQIKFTGLRPGEKLYEELLNNEENTLPTHHPQIMIGKVRRYDFNMICEEIEELISLFDKQDNTAIVRKMKQIVPEYKSQNSVFEKLDD